MAEGPGYKGESAPVDAAAASAQADSIYVTLVEHSNDGIIILQDGRVAFVNRKMLEFTAYPLAEVLGKPFIDFITPQYQRIVADKYWARVRGENVPGRYPAEIAGGNGSVVPVEINACLIEYGGKPATMAIVRDISAQKAAEAELSRHRDHLEKLVGERTDELARKNQELEQSNLRLQEIDRLKSVFLASMSHELRTPLNSILGFTSIILQGMAGPVNDEQKTQLTMVKNSARHLLELINDIIDTSRIEAGKAELSLEEFKFNDVVGEVVQSFTPPAKEKGLALQITISGDILLYSDRKRVKQVLSNLIGNAVKFTDKGTVNIEARVAGEVLECSIVDTGKGIAIEDVSRLFQPFQQVDFSLIKKYQGTGLGLYLCNRILALLGGSISVLSEVDRGSKFTFVLPLKRQEKG